MECADSGWLPELLVIRSTLRRGKERREERYIRWNRNQMSGVLLHSVCACCYKIITKQYGHEALNWGTPYRNPTISLANKSNPTITGIAIQSRAHRYTHSPNRRIISSPFITQNIIQAPSHSCQPCTSPVSTIPDCSKPSTNTGVIFNPETRCLQKHA